MKYEISQQGYVDFLNSLTTTQASTRFPNYSNYRHAITVSSGVYSTTNPFVACNYINWADLAAYLDWSGLRPMTELEFEKSCRGTLPAVPSEYAWGTTGIASSYYTLSNSGANNENIATNYSTSLGNAATYYTIPYGDSINGPHRVGIFAGNGLNTGRVTAGATYYGIMEMTGNLYERPVTVGKPAGRGFIGTNGNGLLDISGNADASNWPGITAVGSGFRGGGWNNSEMNLRVSGRSLAAFASNDRYYGYGGRGVRGAP
jgi:formylglycine-generating enzyme required for sulfatase activity